MDKPIKYFSEYDLRSEFKDIGQPDYRVTQILDWIYNKNVFEYDEMTNLPKSLRSFLNEHYPLTVSRIQTKQISKDKSRKYLITYDDGLSAEAVGIPSSDGRLTICVSSQIGCKIACRFCATGMSGYSRNLHPGEIVDQILCIQDDFNVKATNVVVMGQGEPFLNYENVLGALRIINNSKLLNIGARHITVSTCGIIKGIDRFALEPEQFTLAISLHSANQKIRDSLMPSMANTTLENLHDSLVRYNMNSNRRVTLEYLLIHTINDSNDSLYSLIDFCSDLHCHVNLIPLNTVTGSMFKPSPNTTLDYWNSTLAKSGIPSSIRRSKGSDITAACGQLALNGIQSSK